VANPDPPGKWPFKMVCVCQCSVIVSLNNNLISEACGFKFML